MYVRRPRGFALIEVMLVVTILLSLVVGASLYISNSKRTMVEMQNSSACAGFAQSVSSNIQGGTNALNVRNYLPTRYNSVTPYTVADAQDPLCNANTGTRSALCDTQPLIGLTPDNFVQYDQPTNRYKVMTSLNVRGTSTWAINLYNSCGPSGAACPFGGDISTGIVLDRSAFDQFRNILPEQNLVIPPEIDSINFRLVARPAAAGTIDLNWSGVLTFNVSATTESGQTCLVPPVMVSIGRDAESPKLAGIYLATLRTAPNPFPADLLLARNPNPAHPRTSAYSNASDPTSPSANMNNYVPSGGIPLIDFQLNPNANSCTCSPSEFLRYGRKCPHWTRTVYLEAQSNEAGTLMLCQRTRSPASTDATGADIGRNDLYRYCAMGLADLGDPANDPCLVQLPLAPGVQRLCSTATYNSPSRVVLVWNNLPDGEYQALFKPVDTSGNASATPYPVSFKVRTPSPDFASCPDSSTLCPGQIDVTVADPVCGYRFSCPGTRPICPDTQNYCPDSSPCWATGTCGGLASKPTPACGSAAPSCPNGTRSGVGCDTTPYVACTDQPLVDDCGNACPPRPRVSPTPPPASALAELCPSQSINVCGTHYYGTKTTGCGASGSCCPSPDQLCSGQTFVKDCDGVTACPGTRGMVCPPATDYCGTMTFTCGTSSVTCSGGTNCTAGTPPPGPPTLNCDANNFAYYKPNGDLVIHGQPCTGCPTPAQTWHLRASVNGIIVDPTRDNPPGYRLLDRGNTAGQPVKFLCPVCAPDGHTWVGAHGKMYVSGTYPSCSPFNVANLTKVHWGPGATYTPYGEPYQPSNNHPNWGGPFGSLINKHSTVTTAGADVGGPHFWMVENEYFTYRDSISCCSGQYYQAAYEGADGSECYYGFDLTLTCGVAQCQAKCPPPEMYCATDRIGDGCGGCCPAGTNSSAKMTCLGDLAPSCPVPTPAPRPGKTKVDAPPTVKPGLPMPSGPAGTVPPEALPPSGPGCTASCPKSLTDNYCIGEAAMDTCGNKTCTGTRDCACNRNCPASVTSGTCTGQPTGVSDGCGGECLGTMNCAACVCDPAQTNNYCQGSPAHDSCGRWPWQGGSCLGTQPPSCIGGVPNCGGVCATPVPTPVCENECSDDWDCGSGTCDPYTNCSTPSFRCERGANGCNQCVYQGMCAACSPSFY